MSNANTLISQDIIDQLQQSVRSGNWDTIALAIEDDPRVVAAADADGVTLLHRAVGAGNEFIVARLLEYADCPLDAQDALNGRTPLHYAANKHHLSIIKLLLAAGANAHLADFTGQFPLDFASNKESTDALRTITLTPAICLRRAISEGACERVRRLLTARPDLLSTADLRGSSLLCQVIDTDNQQMLATLISAGVPLTLANNEGQQPLSKAVQMGKLPLVSQLLQAGADVASADNQQITALHLAAGHGDVTSSLLSIPGGLSLPASSNVQQCAFDFFAEDVATEEVIGFFAEENSSKNYPAIASELLANGAQVNAVARGGVTALHLAAARGDNEIVQMLLDHHATVDPLLAGLHASPALLAADNKHLHTLQLLLNAGTNRKLRDCFGRNIAKLLK